MSGALFPSTSFDFDGTQDGLYSSLGGSDQREMERRQEQFPLLEEPRRSPSLCLLPANKSNSLPLDEYLDSCFTAPRPPLHEIRKLENTFKHAKSLVQSSTVSFSLELLNSYGSGIKKLNLTQLNDAKDKACSGSKWNLSTEETMRVAGVRYIQFSEQSYDELSILMHPFGYALTGLSEQEIWNVELAHLLLAAAEKVGFRQFDCASRLLSRCEWIASNKANPVQRVVYCFAEALRERIDKEAGRSIPKPLGCQNPHGLSTSLAFLSHHQNVPLNPVIQLTTTQTIIENIGSARKLHVIDLEIRSGIQWTALMQALVERQQPTLRHFKITAVGCLRQRDRIHETGKRLENFAESMNIPFSYKVAYYSSWNEIREEQFDLAADESLIVSANITLRTMMSRPECLENLMRVIKNIGPSLMIVCEAEANLNSPAFVTRFIEALFYYSAQFDSINTCMSQNVEHRKEIEATFAHGIRDTVAMEGRERIARCVRIDVWRAFFSKFRMVEIGFSESSLYQANLVLQQSRNGNLCSLDKNGKSLLIGWKGTPLFSLSAWKFCRDKLGTWFINLGFEHAT
ncbi:hypothetical protein K2173_000861 [Erythroxylum novogranatense]|uniref:Uncharacterized protein n=1 Tax=Erythroxylum novogranatense TaxID=1862640 RepID=A0AAV8S899_9ROSI|nr:hypothetical protein K2173_000861 [Erythroxylum novogranatense]